MFDKKIALKSDPVQLKPLEVKVTSSFEDALRRFKSLVQKEKIISECKERMYYEKPSEKKRRKRRETANRNFLQNMREELIKTGEWDRRKKRKEQKKAEKAAKKIKRQEDLYE